VDTATTNAYNYDRNSLRVRAAVYLYDLTGQSAYRTYVESTYTNFLAISSGWWGPYETPVQDALLFYSTLPGVTPAVATNLRNSKQGSINGGDFVGAWNAGTDPYRAYVPDWLIIGAITRRNAAGACCLPNRNTYGLNPGQAATYRAAAEGSCITSMGEPG